MHRQFIGRHLRAERLAPALHRRVIAPREPDVLRLVLLSVGRLSTSAAAHPSLQVDAPAMLVFAVGDEPRLVFDAGTRAALVLMSEADLADALGDDPEAPAVRAALTRSTVLTDLEITCRQRLERRFDGLADELDRETPLWMALSAQIRLIAVEAFRLTGGMSPPGAVRGEGLSVLQRFRQLVESEFRRQRPISYYAHELGMTADRLHAIATRHLGRSPIELVHDRLVQEARLRLERSTLSVQSISDSLNFKDPAHFSRFFKRRTGLSPLRYRLALREASQTRDRPPPAEYHDWP